MYAEGDADESSLVIKRRTSAGVESTILTDTQDLDALTDLDDAGGAYLGAHECLYHNSQLYFLAPIQRVDSDGANRLSTHVHEKKRRAWCYFSDVTAGTPSLTVVETWDFVTVIQRQILQFTTTVYIILSNQLPPRNLNL